jgi:formylglycine-generating enzyme required for sulfatase activity
MPTEAPVSWTNSLEMDFVRIEAGEFMQGSPLSAGLREDNETPHLVRITRPFWMGTTHVTVGHFREFAKATGYQSAAEKQGWSYGAWNVEEDQWDKYDNGSWKNPGFEQGDDYPVVCITWHDAVAFCEFLSKKEGRTYRLPTEAEWECCCRAGATTVYPWGDNPNDGEGWANGADATSEKEGLFTLFPSFKWSDGYLYSSPVATFHPNAFGLYDVVGNVLQWCGDWSGDYPAEAVEDPTGPIEGEQRILRGGGFVYGPDRSRCAFRGRNWPDFQNFYVGFRVLIESEGEIGP